jgi:hypothetical protein
VAEKHHQEVLAFAERMLCLLGEDDAREYIRITGRLAEIITENINSNGIIGRGQTW